MNDDDYAYVAAQAEAEGRRRGWNEALDAAKVAVEGIRDAIYTHYRIDCEPLGKVDWSQHRKCDPIDEVVAAIDALRKNP